MNKEFHYVVLHDSSPYFGEIQYLSLLSKIYCYPEYIHTIWTNNVEMIDSKSYYISLLNIALHRGVKIRVKDLLKEYPAELTPEEMSRWGVLHKDPKRALAYKSDYYRFMILRDHGGIYSDLDCISLKPYPFMKVIGKETMHRDPELNKFYSRVKCIIGTQTSHRYKGTSIHFIASEPGSPFITTYIKLRDQNATGSAQCGFRVLEHLDAFSSTLVHKETVFSHTIQDELLDKFTPKKLTSFRRNGAYELHLPGPEGKHLIDQTWFMKFIKELVNSLS